MSSEPTTSNGIECLKTPTEPTPNGIECFKIPIRSMVKSVGPRLVPFFKSIAVFFILYPSQSYPTFVYTAVKAAPIVSLIAFVLMNGTGLTNQYYMYSRRVFAGLIASCIGDIFIVFQSFGFIYFLIAAVCFAVAHIFYSIAFGLKPFNSPMLAILVAFYSTVFFFLNANLDVTFMVIYGIYGLILITMVWRAVSRLQFFDDLWTWTKLCSCVGAILFAISDCVLAFEMFVLPHSTAWTHFIIMVTYYAGQLGIALSVVDSQVDEFLHCPIRYKYTLKEESK